MPIALHSDLLVDMRVGWAKVADAYGMTLYVYQLPDGRFTAVTNQAQMLGEPVEVISPTSSAVAVANLDEHGLPFARPYTPETKRATSSAWIQSPMATSRYLEVRYHRDVSAWLATLQPDEAKSWRARNIDCLPTWLMLASHKASRVAWESARPRNWRRT